MEFGWRRLCLKPRAGLVDLSIMSRGEDLPIPVDWPNSHPTSTGTWLGPERRARKRPEPEIGTSTPQAVPELDAPASDPRTTSHPPTAGLKTSRSDRWPPRGKTGPRLTSSSSWRTGRPPCSRRPSTRTTRGTSHGPNPSSSRRLLGPLKWPLNARRIAYRQAALAADHAGNGDGADHWMRLAGREYLRVTEDVRTPLPFIREAALMAAKCFLKVKNENVASKGLRRAQAIDSVLRADDDLTAPSTGIPFRHESGPDDRSLPEPEDSSSLSRLQRLRQRLAGRSAA